MMEMQPEKERSTERSGFEIQNGSEHIGSPAAMEDSLPPKTSRRKVLWASLVAIFALLILITISGGLESLARDLFRIFGPTERVTESDLPVLERPSSSGAGLFTFEGSDLHPDVLFLPYTAGPILSEESAASQNVIHQFRNLLDLYAERQGTDDNFTIRVVDNRTNELLEIYEFEDERSAYENRSEGESWDWGRIDRLRRDATRNLVQKYVARGIPRGAVTVKWGRRNQVLEAREREAEFIEYEVQLARFLGLSLLTTEIGTVETFNDDRLVSPVGARSRYQMMPYVLRQNGIHHYKLPTAAGNAIDVYEEWHPLLTMEPAFVTAAGYVNAVGHEIPGLSAYHTGPGNIYSVYRMFLTAEPNRFTPETTVMDAYMWAVTEGYDHVSRNSSFKSYSRGYVASAYGALRATESIPVDPSKSLRTVRVQLRPGERLFLSDLLRTLAASGQEFDWGPDTEGMTLYNKFRKLNKHFALPAGGSEDASVKPNADLRLTADVKGIAVRFFLPPGAPEALKAAGMNVLDDDRSFRYDENTYGRPDPAEITLWDRQYQQLVNDIAYFGFTREYRDRLAYLVDKFEELAKTNPTLYRRMQLEVIKTHERIWKSNVFDKLADVLRAVRGSQRFEARPLSPLPLGQTEG